MKRKGPLVSQMKIHLLFLLVLSTWKENDENDLKLLQHPSCPAVSRVAPNCCFTTTHCKPQFWAEGCQKGSRYSRCSKDLQLNSSHSRFCLFSCFPMQAESFPEFCINQFGHSLAQKGELPTNTFRWRDQNPTALQPKSNESPNKDHGDIG